MKKILLDESPAELEERLAAMGQPSFRAGQIYGWLSRGSSFAEMKNVPKELREQLTASFSETGVRIAEEFVSRDGTKKYIFELSDGNVVEGVLMKYKYGYTTCISTQVGCRMGCRFCASTLNGLVRNLSAGEMLGEVIAVNRTLGEGERKISNIVLMGSGEPLDNYDEVVRFLRAVRDPAGLGISLRNVSLSTCGITQNIRRLADENLGVTLSISLHAPNDELRRTIMPTARKYSIGEIMEAARYYVEKTGRRVIFEYALIRGTNDTAACAEELADLVKGLQCHVNLIPLNEVKERRLAGSRKADVAAFREKLNERKVSCSVRREMGSDISGACGQLRAGYMKEKTL